MEFDYKNKGMRIKSSYVYAKDGTCISSMPSYMVKTSFDSIIPGSLCEAIFQATSKEYHAQYEKK